MSRKTLDALTGLRFLAAIHVVGYHFAVRLVASCPPIDRFLRMGYVGVTLFFVLSGFVLAYNYTGADGGLSIGRRAFWAARFARVYPLYLVALLLSGPGYFLFLHAQLGARSAAIRAALSGAPAVVLLQAWSPLTVLTWNGPGWSLSVEAFFYLLFPFLIGRVRCETRQQLVVAGAALFVAANAAPVALLALSRSWDLAGTSVALLGAPISAATIGERIVGFWPILRLPEFVFGIYLGKYHLARRARGEAGAGRAGAALAAGSLALLVVSFSFAGGYVELHPLFHNGLFLPLFGALILGLAEGEGRLVRALGSPPMQRLGEASYAVYILQDPVWMLLGWSALPAAMRAARSPSAPVLALYLALLITCSFLAYRWIEVPGRERLKRLLIGRSTPPDPAALPAAR